MRNKAELEYLGQRNGWQIKPVTQAEIGRMSSDEYEWNERFNSENLQKAISEPARRAEAEREGIRLQGKSIWSGLLAAYDFYEEQQRWVTEHPQYVSTYVPNLEAIATKLRQKNLVPSYTNIDKVFCDLATEGRLLLSPQDAGIGPETELSGYALRTYPNLWRLLEPVRKTDAATEQIEKMSADEFRATTPELQDRRVPPILQQKVNQILVSFRTVHPEYVECESNATAITEAILESGGPVSTQSLESVYQSLLADGKVKTNPEAQNSGQMVSFTDLGGRQAGFPSESAKYSFKKLIRGMSADEIAQRCLDDPAFRRALDDLEK